MICFILYFHLIYAVETVMNQNRPPSEQNFGNAVPNTSSLFPGSIDQTATEGIQQNNLYNPNVSGTENFNLGGLIDGWGNFQNVGFDFGNMDESEHLTPQQLHELEKYLDSLSVPNSQHFVGNHSNQVTSSCDVTSSNSINSFSDFQSTDESNATGVSGFSDGYSQWTSAFQHLAAEPSHAQGTYSPFGIHSISEESCRNSFNNVKSGEEAIAKPVNTKPSFADVARNRSSASNGNEKNHYLLKTKSLLKDQTSGVVKDGQKLHMKRNKVLRPNAFLTKVKSQVQPPDIKPNSRYGLDTFDDRKINLKENLTRKNSGSSLSSGFSGLEDIVNDKVSCDGEKVPSVSISTSDTEPILQKEESINGTKIEKLKFKRKQATDEKSTPSPTDKVFFDPKRIFQNSANNDFIPNNKQRFPNEKESLLGKEKNKTFASSGSTKYINNDLRDNTKKHLNLDNVFMDQNNKEFSKKTSNGSNAAGRNRGKAMSRSDLGTSQHRSAPKISNKKEKMANGDHMLGHWLLLAYEWTLWFSKEFLAFAWSIFKLILSVALLLAALITHYTVIVYSKSASFMKESFPRFKQKDTNNFDWTNPMTQPRQRQYGLKENIVLPSTGNEAMKRLLSCKGKDPYSILGVRGDACDEDIKKYYRKQAVLVHPDKNTQPGAEEAFKILGHAFELIGSPEKRTEYNADLDRKDAETAMQEFADLLTKLHDKMQEANNLLRCDNCGGKHKRVPTDRPMYSARYCDRCNTMHAVKEGDVWAESKMLGFLWHYYACMDSKIFDITEWASCKRGNFKSLQANSHQVIYRLSTGASKNKNSSRQGEAKLEHFLNNLFHSASNNTFNTGETSTSTSGPHKGRGGSADFSSKSSGSGNKTTSRKKKNKKH